MKIHVLVLGQNFQKWSLCNKQQTMTFFLLGFTLGPHSATNFRRADTFSNREFGWLVFLHMGSFRADAVRGQMLFTTPNWVYGTKSLSANNDAWWDWWSSIATIEGYSYKNSAVSRYSKISIIRTVTIISTGLYFFKVSQYFKHCYYWRLQLQKICFCYISW